MRNYHLNFLKKGEKPILQENLEFVEKELLKAVKNNEKILYNLSNIFNKGYTNFNERYLSQKSKVKKMEECLNAWYAILGKDYKIRRNAISLKSIKVSTFEDIFSYLPNEYTTLYTDFQNKQHIKYLKQAINIYKVCDEYDRAVENYGSNLIDNELKSISNHFKMKLGDFKSYGYDPSKMLARVEEKINRRLKRGS